MRSVSSWLKI